MKIYIGNGSLLELFVNLVSTSGQNLCEPYTFH